MLLEMPAEEMLVETMPRMNANAPMPPAHTTRLPRSLRSACAVGEDEQPQARRRRVSRAGSTPVPMSRRGGDPRGDGEQQRGRREPAAAARAAARR